MSFGDLKVQDLIYEDSSNNEITVVIADLATKVNPVFSGTVTVPTATAGDNSTKAASTAFVVASFAPKNAPAFTGSATGVNLTLSGDLTVNGTTTTINTTTLQVEDKNIEIGKVASPSDTTADGGGWTLLGATNKTFNWLNATDSWTSSEHIEIASGKNLKVDGTTFFVDGTNNRVGIGLTNPSYKVDILEAAGNGLRIKAGDASADIAFSVGSAGTADKFVIQSGGKVGIGGTPQQLLHVQTSSGDCIVRVTSPDGSGAFLDLGDASDPDGGRIVYDTGSNLILNTASSERLRISSAGAFGIAGANYGTSGQVLTSGGSGAAPSWAAAPAGGNTFTAVANGNIANNKAVKLDSDGKVSEIAETVSAVTSINNGTGTGSGSYAGLTVGTVNAAAFSVTSGLGYYFSQDTQSSPYQVKATAVRFDGNDGTFGIKAGASRQNITAITTDHCWKPHAAWDAANNKIMVVYQRDSNGQLYGTWLTPNQSSNPYFTASGTELHPFPYDFDDVPKIVYGGSGRFLTAFCTKASSWNIKTRAIYYNSGSYSLGGYTDLTPDGTSSAKPRDIDLAYHTANDKVIAVWQDGSNSNYGKIRVGSWTGSGGSLNISWGTESTFAPGAIEHPQVIVDDNTGKIVICYYNNATSTWNSKVGVLSGTSVTFGSAVQVSSVGGMNSDNDWGFDLIYVSGVQKVKFYWNGNTGGYKGQTATGTVSSSSSTITWSNVGTIMSNGLNQGVAVFAATPDTTYNRVFYYGQDVSYANTGRFKTEVLSTPVTNLTDANDCIGFADQAYTNGQTATIKTYGNNIDTLSGLTIGSLYYVQGDGTLDTSWDSSGLSSFASNTPLAGIALSATKLLIRDPLART
jgi:hypothetical protein